MKLKVSKELSYYLIHTKQILESKEDIINDIGGTENNIKLLREVLNFHNKQYYILDDPKVSDKEYDDLFNLLVHLEKKNPHLLTPDSPTQRVGRDITGNFASEEHLSPMLSLENSYNASDILEWSKRIEEKIQEDICYTTEPKFDGAGISVTYENNHLSKALTRGDGIKGENITNNAKQILSIPLYVNFLDLGIKKIEIRGEVIMSKKKFLSFNEKLKMENQPPLINPRNAASGALRMKSSQEVKKRKLEVFFYHISYYETLEGKEFFHYHSEVIEYLNNIGFQTPISYFKKCHSIKEVIHTHHTFEEKRDNLNYEMDGLVVKVDNLQWQKQLGFTSHHPRWGVAYKFKAKQMNSVILDVHFQVGRTGIITPVAKIEPIELSGATLSSISLFNEKNILEKDFRINDTVLVERAGDVIPYLVKSFPELRKGDEKEILFPKVCPCCNTLLIKEDLEAWICPNKGCKDQVIGGLIHFASKDAMDIRSLGEANIVRFYELGFLKTIIDIYKLPYNDIKKLKGMGEKSVENLQLAIEDSKHRLPEKLLYALGISHVGQVLAKMLCKRYKDIFKLAKANLEELEQIEDVGPKVAKSIYNYFNNTNNLDMLYQLKDLGLCFVNTKEAMFSEEPFLEGKSFLFTGTLHNRKREEAEILVEKYGGTIASGVNKKLNYLVVGDKAGSKLEKAKNISTITILSEKDFEKILETKNISL